MVNEEQEEEEHQWNQEPPNHLGLEQDPFLSRVRHFSLVDLSRFRCLFPPESSRLQPWSSMSLQARRRLVLVRVERELHAQMIEAFLENKFPPEFIYPDTKRWENVQYQQG